MASRRNYFTMTTIMAVVFLMFMFTNIVLEDWTGYEMNSYAQNRTSLAGQGSAYQAGQDEKGVLGYSRKKVVYIGRADGATGKIVCSWVNYTKRSLSVYSTVEEYAAALGSITPEMLIINAEDISWEQLSVCKQLEESVQQGVNLVFCNLPGVSVIMENRQLRQLLGIEEIRKEAAAVEAIHLYGGFLLGGEAVYQAADEAEEEKRQDMELSFPWYGLSEDTKVYMCGIPKERVKAENRPPVIWRHNLDNAQVFVVNGKYMEDAAGLGLLTAMSAEARGYEIYPVVNAQNMVILNGPGMAAEYGETLKKQYGQSMPLLLRDVVWPLIVSTYKRCSLGLTCMISPQYDYVDDNFPSESELEYYMKRLKEQSAEAGLSGKNRSNTPINRKINEDERFVSATLPDYRFSSFYAGSLTELELDSILQEDMLEAVRTVVRDYSAGSEVIGYRSEYITSQSVLFNGVEYSFRDDFTMRCIETALGYTSVGIDLGDVLCSDNDQEGVDRILSEFGWSIRTYWKNFKAFSGTTLSESDQRIRSFLALDYGEERVKNVINLDFTGTEMSAWFVLKTNGEKIRQVEGGRCMLLERGAYLIETDETHLRIKL